VLSRVIYVSRASLAAGCISIALALAIGVPLGLIAGYVGGLVDALLSRMTDAMLAIPFLILAIALAAFLGPSLGNAMIAIGVTTTPIFVRLTRGQVMAVKVEDYIEAARGRQPRWRIMHICPTFCPPCWCRRRCRWRRPLSPRRRLPPGSAATAGAVVGQHAQLGAAVPGKRTVDGGMAGSCDLPDRPLVQSRGRRAARRARPAFPIMMPARHFPRGLQITMKVGHPVAVARPDDDDEETERQVDGNIADAFQAGAGGLPMLGVEAS
jgi:hypothetical protein